MVISSGIGCVCGRIKRARLSRELAKESLKDAFDRNRAEVSSPVRSRRHGRSEMRQ